MKKILLFLLNIAFIFPIIAMKLTENEEAFFKAIQDGDVNEVNRLLAMGMINIDKQDADGNTPLIIAVMQDKPNNIDIIKAILNEIPNALISNKKSEIAIQLAQTIKNNKNAILDMLRNAAKQYAFYEEIIKPKPNPLMVTNTLNQISQITNSPNSVKNFLALAITKDKTLIDQLIAKGADVNQILRDGKTPLIMAIEERATDIVNQLLAAGADPLLKNPAGKTAFDVIEEKLAEKGLGTEPKKVYEQIKSALQAKSETSLLKTIETGDVSTIKNLIPKFFSAKKALEVAINNNSKTAVNKLLNIFPELVANIDAPIDNAGNTALMLAIMTVINTGDIGVLQIILSQVPDPSVNNAMNLATINSSDTDQVKERKDALNKLLGNGQDQYNLYKAIYDGEALVKVEPLITAGVTLAIPNPDRNPLVLAIAAAQPDLVKLLVEKKPDKAGINQILGDGKTPLQVAQEEFNSASISEKGKYEAIIKILKQVVTPTIPPVTVDAKPLLSTLQKLSKV